MHDKLSNRVAYNQAGLNQTYAEADMSISSLWAMVRKIHTDLDTLTDALKDTSPMKEIMKSNKRRAFMHQTQCPHAFSLLLQPAALSRAAL